MSRRTQKPKKNWVTLKNDTSQVDLLQPLGALLGFAAELLWDAGELKVLDPHWVEENIEITKLERNSHDRARRRNRR